MKNGKSSAAPLPARSNPVEIPEKTFGEIKGILEKKTGLDIGGYKDKCIRRRIAVRIRRSGCLLAKTYLERLKSDDAETAELLRVLTINVTQFFRNMSAFEKMRDVVFPEIFKYKSREGDYDLRIWSAGCSSGEEPYSVAILLKEYFQKELKRFSPFIIATDFDEDVVGKAREGVYNERNLKEMPAGFRERYFSQVEGGYRISDRIRRMVIFKRRNLLADRIYRDQDLILCRNILIYFSREQQQQILVRLAGALSRGGFLALGKAETMTGASRGYFKVICPTERIYQKV